MTFYTKTKISRKQQTIENAAIVSGHTFRYFDTPSQVIFHPCDRQGIFLKFKNHEVRVSPDNVFADSNHCTSIKRDEAEIKESEHILSAIIGLGITNIVVEFSNVPEPPIMDGSSLEFVNALIEAQIIELEEQTEVFRITKEKKFTIPNTDSYIICRPHDDFKVTIITDFPAPIGKQEICLNITGESYLKEISFARPPLRGSLDKIPKSEIKKLFPGYREETEPIILYNDDKYLTKLRAIDEVVRHKALDFIGDLATIGIPIIGEFICYKSGHKIHTEFAKLFK